VSRGLRQHENKKLAELDLGYNEIKDEGACAIAQVCGGFWQHMCDVVRSSPWEDSHGSYLRLFTSFQCFHHMVK